jgi:hypothetical protein
MSAAASLHCCLLLADCHNTDSKVRSCPLTCITATTSGKCADWLLIFLTTSSGSTARLPKTPNPKLDPEPKPLPAAAAAAEAPAAIAEPAYPNAAAAVGDEDEVAGNDALLPLVLPPIAALPLPLLLSPAVANV